MFTNMVSPKWLSYIMKIERECVITRAANHCDADCANCSLVQKDSDLVKAYGAVINILDGMAQDCGEADGKVYIPVEI